MFLSSWPKVVCRGHWGLLCLLKAWQLLQSSEDRGQHGEHGGALRVGDSGLTQATPWAPELFPGWELTYHQRQTEGLWARSLVKCPSKAQPSKAFIRVGGPMCRDVAVYNAGAILAKERLAPCKPNKPDAGGLSPGKVATVQLCCKENIPLCSVAWKIKAQVKWLLGWKCQDLSLSLAMGWRKELQGRPL